MQVTYVQPDGSSRTLDGKAGQTVMELAVKNRVKGIIAECGGSCSCATCHVHIDPAWQTQAGPASKLEKETLILADDLTDASRLSCQIKLTPALDGLIVHLPNT